MVGTQLFFRLLFVFSISVDTIIGRLIQPYTGSIITSTCAFGAWIFGLRLSAKTPDQLRDWLKDREMWIVLPEKVKSSSHSLVSSWPNKNHSIYWYFLSCYTFLSLPFDYYPIPYLWVVVTFIMSSVYCRVTRWNNIEMRRGVDSNHRTRCWSHM